MPPNSIASDAVRNVLRGALMYGGLGAVVGALFPRKGKTRRQSALRAGLTAGTVGGLLSGINGLPRAQARGAGRARMQQGLDEVAPFLKDVKTKAEAKKRFYAAARDSHPDLHGGNGAVMRDINVSWQNAQNHPDFKKLGYAYTSGLYAALNRFNV